MVEGILQGMQWLGLYWDEGPYYQTQRVDLYRAAAARLLDSGAPTTASAPRKKSNARAPKPPRTNGLRDTKAFAARLIAAERLRRKTAGEAAAVRFAVPETGSTAFDDAVFGKVEFANTEIEDFVLLRNDGSPTYHLSVVADDIDLRISHIIRGADHISNTPKQVLLYQALGAALPVFAHVPLILGPDKTRLSKRHGATSVIAYREEGIVPEAFRNFLALLGWTPPEATPAKESRRNPAAGKSPTKEILADAELIRLFNLDSISRSNAVFDRAKLDWFNTEYIRAYSAERLLPLIEEEWKKVGLAPAATASHCWRRLISEIPRPQPERFRRSFRAFFSDEFDPDPAAVEKFLKDESVRKLLIELGERYAALQDFSEPETEKLLRDFAAEKGVKAGALINGARVALTGQGVAPSLFAVMLSLGKDKTAARLRAVEHLAARAVSVST